MLFAGVLSSARIRERGGEERRGGVTNPVPRNILQTHLRLGTKLWLRAAAHIASWSRRDVPLFDLLRSRDTLVKVAQLLLCSLRRPLPLLDLCVYVLGARRWDIRNGESVGGDDARWCAVGKYSASSTNPRAHRASTHEMDFKRTKFGRYFSVSQGKFDC